LLAVLVFPAVSAFAESLTVTTNKDIYTSKERVIVIGVVPEGAPEGYAVLVTINGPDGKECSLQTILPDSDSSFVSRPLRLEPCGSGEYTVLAYYAELSANSTFTVSNNGKSGQGNNVELRILRNVILQAQETVNLKIREFLEANYVLPEDIAAKYSQGVFEASLAIQAIDFGDSGEAKKHLIFAIGHLRGVIDALSAQRAVFDQAAELQLLTDDSGSSLLERYERLKEFYFRLKEVAEANGVDRAAEFDSAVSLLADSKRMIDEGNSERAANNLDKVNEMLESIRQGLFEDGETASALASNSTRQDDPQARRLASAADKFEMRARGLLEDNENPDADSKVQEALTLISAARTAIVDGDYQYARKALSAAFSALNEAEKLHDDGGDDDSDDGSGKNDQESEGSDHGSDHEKEESDHDDNENSSNDDNSGTG
jgi:hypothetical protein